MKQEISVLMDGELFEDEAEHLLTRLKRDPEAQQAWQTYHLIGDALRQPEFLAQDFSAKLNARLAAEPTVFAPAARSRKKIEVFAMSAAASVMALALVVWLSQQIGSQPTAQMAMSNPSNDIRPVNYVPNQMNDYLMAHQEFSPSTEVRGAASYMRTVATQ
jgi:sigma-E factor negative regulatory protein RseA